MAGFLIKGSWGKEVSGPFRVLPRLRVSKISRADNHHQMMSSGGEMKGMHWRYEITQAYLTGAGIVSKSKSRSLVEVVDRERAKR